MGDRRRLKFADRTGWSSRQSRHSLLASGTQVEEILVVGAARPANGQMSLGAGQPVADRDEIFVICAAPRAGREVPSHRGPLLAVQRADHERREVIAPPGAALSHLLS